MNQQINLFLPEFRKEKDWLNADGLVQIMVLVIVLLASISGFQYWQQSSLKNELSQKQQQRLQQINQTNALIDQFGSQEEDPALVLEVQELEDNLRGKQVLLSFLMGNSVGNTQGFSEHLADLARYHMDGLRITGVNLQNGGASIMLSGEVVQAEIVPLFLQNLSQGQTFVGKRFDTLRMEVDQGAISNNGLLMFDVATSNGE